MEKNIEIGLKKLENDINLRTTEESWCIRFNNRMVQVNSGKRVWNKQGFAKSAFVNYIKYSFTRKSVEEMGFKNGKELSHYLLNTGIIKIEKL